MYSIGSIVSPEYAVVYINPLLDLVLPLIIE